MNELFTRPPVLGFTAWSGTGKTTLLELHRAATGQPLLYPDDDSIIAVLSNTRLDADLPQPDLNDAPAVAAFILEYVKTPRATG